MDTLQRLRKLKSKLRYKKEKICLMIMKWQKVNKNVLQYLVQDHKPCLINLFKKLAVKLNLNLIWGLKILAVVLNLNII